MRSGLVIMRILHILDHSIPLQSGYTFRTLSILREQRALQWDTIHLTSSKQGSGGALEEQCEDWHFFRTAESEGPMARLPVLNQLGVINGLARRLEELASRLKPDILHAHSPALNAIAALRVGRKLGIPVVYEIRAFWEDAAVDHGTSMQWGIRYRLTRALESFAARQADAVTTICEGLRRDIVGRGIPATKVTVIPNAVNLDSFDGAATRDHTLAVQLGLTGKTVLGFIGSFYAYEGLDTLLRALPSVLASIADARVLLVGGGPQEHALRALANELGVADKVVFAGPVPHAQVPRFYELIDVLAYPRRKMRLTDLVTPLKPLEAMAQGRLLIASDVGGHRELIRDGETGLLFEAGNADALAAQAIALLGDPGRWPALRGAGRHYVETERNWRSSVARYGAVYAAAAARRAA
jgi:PEP-CTERM/exosortase A-associated glycosyltransferase